MRAKTISVEFYVYLFYDIYLASCVWIREKHVSTNSLVRNFERNTRADFRIFL